METFSCEFETSYPSTMKEASHHEKKHSLLKNPTVAAVPGSRDDHKNLPIEYYYMKTKDDLKTLFENARTGMTQRVRSFLPSIDMTRLPNVGLVATNTWTRSSPDWTTTGMLHKPSFLDNDDETSSTGTVDTMDDLPNSFEDWSESSPSEEEEAASLAVLRMQRIRARYLPFLSSSSKQATEPYFAECEQHVQVWSLCVFQQANQVRYHLKDKDQAATMVLYNEEIMDVVQNLVKDSECQSQPPLLFELFMDGQTEPMQLSGSDVLANLTNMAAQVGGPHSE